MVSVIRVCVLLSLVLFNFSPAWSSEKQPLKINSNKLSYLQENKLIVFEGEVKADNGEMELEANRLEVYLKDAPQNEDLSPEEQKIEKIIAIGDVLITKEGRKAKCGRAIYYPAEDKVRLEGNPSIWQDKNVIKGETILFFLKNNAVQVLGNSKKRVEAVFYPKKEAKIGE